MRIFSRIAGGLRALVRRDRIESELDHELREYLAAAADAKVARGMSREQALRQARAEMGSTAAVKDWVRDVGWESRVESVWQDVRYAVRLLRRSPGFASAAIVTFALGIGASTAIFSLVDAAILRPLPYHEPDRLVTVSMLNAASGRTTTGMMPRDFLDWRERQQVFDHIAVTGGATFTLLGTGEPEEVRVVRVTEGFFEMLAVRPRLGRLFTRSDEQPGRGEVAILSHGFWQTRFGGAPDVVGRTLRLGDRPYEIVGVLPQAFVYPAGSRAQTPLFVPVTFTAEDRQHGVVQSMGYSPQGRLRRGVTMEQAEAFLSDLQAAADANKKAFNKGYTRVVVRPQMERYIGTARPWMLTLLGAVTLVLLIACANVANLILAHGATRTRELTIRSALGAGRWRISRQLIVESLVLSGIGGAAGLMLAWWGISVIRAATPGSVPRAAAIALDLRVLGFTGATTIAIGLLCGLAPAMQGSRIDLVKGLKEPGSQGATPGAASRRVRQALVSVEVTLAVVLLIGAGLFITSFARLLRVDQGFDASGVISFGVSLPRASGRTVTDTATIPAMLAALQRIPGLSAALVAGGGGPFEGGYSSFPVRIAGRPQPAPDPKDEPPMIRFRKVSADFFEILRVPLRYGRGLTPHGTAQPPPVAVVNEAAVREFWKGASPIGDRLSIEAIEYEIVGVTADMRYSGPDQPAAPEVFIPYRNARYSAATFLVRSGGKPLQSLPPIKSAIWSVNPALPISNVQTAEELFARATASRRFNMLLMSIFAALALVIAATGTYGVIAFLVNQRTGEIGVRMALGARPADVVRLFMREGVFVVGFGIIAGLVGAWWLVRAIRTFLFEVQPRDPAIFAAVACGLGAVGLLACWIPARRAARVDPLIAIRAE